jgi:hypothetical protein
MTEAAPAPAPRPARAKLTLHEQADFVRYLRDRTLNSRGRTCPGTWMLLDAPDIAALECVTETLRLFALHGADKFVRDEIM